MFDRAQLRKGTLEGCDILKIISREGGLRLCHRRHPPGERL